MPNLYHIDGAVESMRRSGRILAGVHEELAAHVVPGVMGRQLDQLAETYIRDHGAEPAFKGFENFPATICFSMNEGMVHGLPSDQEIQPGDVVKLDIGVRFSGWNTDAARTHLVPPIDPASQTLAQVTRRALATGIGNVKAGQPLGTIQAAIQAVIESAGLGLVRTLTGHGIGRTVHEAPSIPNFGERGKGLQLTEGMAICLEPMVTLGSGEVRRSADGWTYESSDGTLSAHEEDTLLVTSQGCEVLTTEFKTLVHH